VTDAGNQMLGLQIKAGYTMPVLTYCQRAGMTLEVLGKKNIFQHKRQILCSNQNSCQVLVFFFFLLNATVKMDPGKRVPREKE
jgi:hypothetical protein